MAKDQTLLWTEEGRPAVSVRIENLYREGHIADSQMEILRWVRNNHMDNDVVLSAHRRDAGIIQYQLVVNPNHRFTINWEYVSSYFRGEGVPVVVIA